MIKKITFILTLLFSTISFAQSDYLSLSKNYLKTNKSVINLTDEDIIGLINVREYKDDLLNVTHVLLQQTYNNIPIYNHYISLHYDNKNKLVDISGDFIHNIKTKITTSSSIVAPEKTIDIAAKDLEVKNYKNVVLDKSTSNKYTYGTVEGLSRNPITVELVYFVNQKNTLDLSWNVQLFRDKTMELWHYQIDAVTGKILDKKDAVLHCDFNHDDDIATNTQSRETLPTNTPESELLLAGSYRVYPYNIEAPSFGSRQLISNPDNATASPWGWHDTNNAAGNEYTTTRGNNVFAYEDKNDDNVADVGSVPNAGSSLLFDYPLDFTTRPDSGTNAKAAVTQLFYLNNIMHDISYQYGFTESSGNFQQNNYGKGGVGGDFVQAQAHDGSSILDDLHTGNANFATLPEGYSPIMQMYLWEPPTISDLDATSPSYTQLDIPYGPARFGPKCAFDVNQNLVVASPLKGCSALTNASQISGKIAFIERGQCQFVKKVKMAQDAGALAVIIYDSIYQEFNVTMGNGTEVNPSLITIPSGFIRKVVADSLLKYISGMNIHMMRSSPNNCIFLDASLDNGIISHEYTHGISTRLTGNGYTCLENQEQAGEGWSDFFSLFLTHKPTDTKMGYRGLGTYSYAESTTDVGIREYPYSYDMSINPMTFGDLRYQTKYDTTLKDSVAESHRVGTIWCAMLYDMYWNLIDKYGYNTNLYTGNGGNNVAMKLVISGLKLQKCNPSFIDARNAILKSDTLLYGGANSCIIWQSFARRGMGYGASSGNGNSIKDQIVSYALPPSCSIAPPVAKMSDIAATICQGQSITFQSVSTGSPTSVSWNFGGGGTPNTSSANSPVVAFNSVGTYTITLTASNSAGSSSTSKTLVVVAKPNVTVNNATICGGESATLTASGAATYTWAPTNETTVSITVKPTTNTNYYVIGTASNSCTDTATAMVTVNTKPSADASADKAITCTATSVQIGTAAVAGNSYSWSPSTGLSNAGIAQPMATAAGTYRVIVTVTATGCKDTDEVVVTLNNTLPTANAGNDKILTCTAAAVQLDGSSTTSGVTYGWAGPGIASGGATATPTVNAPGVYTLTVTNPANGCSATDQITVNSNTTLPTADAGTDKVITCTTSSVQIGTAAVAGNSYSWSPTSGLSNAGIAQPTATAAGTYTLTVTTTASGCSKTDVVVVTSNTTAPSVSTSGATICTGQSVQLTATGSGATGYSWTGPGIVSGGTTATPTVNAAGTYTVTATNSGNGCTATATAIVTINNSAPTITVNNATICRGESVTLTASGASTYSWSTGQSGSSITVSPTENTTYTATGSTGCNSGSGSGTVTVNAKPEVSVNNATGCPGSSQTLSASGATTYAWSNGASGSSISITVSSSNSTVNVIGTSTGCKDTATAQITALPVPATPSINRADSILTCTVTAASYQWYKDGVEISGATSQSYKMTSNGQYKVVVKNSEGCSAESSTLSVISLPVKNNTGLQGMQIIPNPSKGTFEVRIESSERRDAEVEMYSVSGQKVWGSQWQIERGVNSYRVSEEQLPEGVYFMQINSGGGMTTLRVVIQK